MSWFTALGGGGAAAGGTAAAANVATPGVLSGATGAGVLAPQAAGPVASISGVSGAGTVGGAAIPSIGGGGGIPGMGGMQMPSLGAILEGGTALAQGFATKKQAEAESDLVKAIGIENANRVYARLASIAHRGRAIQGAQGSTGMGSDYNTYLANIYEANLGARSELLPYQARAKAIKKAGDLALRQGIMRAGTSLLTGK